MSPLSITFQCLCLDSDCPQQAEAGQHQEEAAEAGPRGGRHVGGAGGAGGVSLLVPGDDGGRGGRGQHWALGQREARVKCGEDTCNTGQGSAQCLSQGVHNGCYSDH